MSEYATHSDIVRRVEKVEIDVAVLDSKTTRLHQDLTEIKSEIQETSRIARRIQSTVVIVPFILSGIYALIEIINRMPQ